MRAINRYVKSILSNMYFDAIILETYGCGNSLSTDWIKKELKHFIDRGKILINTSQCEAGSINQTRYETGQFLEKIGVISAKDMTFESTLTKTMLLLHDYPKRIDFKQKKLTREIKKAKMKGKSKIASSEPKLP